MKPTAPQPYRVEPSKNNPGTFSFVIGPSGVALDYRPWTHDNATRMRDDLNAAHAAGRASAEARCKALASALEEIEAVADDGAHADYSDAAGRAVPNLAMVIRDEARAALAGGGAS